MIKEDGKPIRCEECIHRRMCGRIMEIFGRQYRVDFCSYGERDKDVKDNRQQDNA